MCKLRKILSLIVATACLVSIVTGCGKNGTVVNTSNLSSIPLQSPLSQQEVLDYYVKSLEYTTATTRNIAEDITEYELNEVTDETTLQYVADALQNIQGALSANAYDVSEKNLQYIDDSTYHYLRAMLNDKKLTNGTVKKIEQALGFYFVTVDYEIGPSPVGTFKDEISLIGIPGTYSRSGVTGLDRIDKNFIRATQNTMNEYFYANGIFKGLFFNGNKLYIEDVEELPVKLDAVGMPAALEEGDVDENVEVIVKEGEEETLAEGETTETTEAVTAENNEAETLAESETEPETNENGETIVAETEEETHPYEGIGQNAQFVRERAAEEEEARAVELEAITPDEEDEDTGHIDVEVIEPSNAIRNTGIDINLILEHAGNGPTEAYIPYLYNIYNIPGNSGGINGIGLYPSGSFGMTQFGFNRQKLTGHATLVYVLKQDLILPSKLHCSNIYVKEYAIENGISANNDFIIPSFLKEDFEIIVDRADRVMMNDDTTAFMKQKVFSDIGMGVLNGYAREYGNVLRQVSTLKRIISRDMSKNAYLVEIESFKQEGSKSADAYASYKDIIYAVIEQSETEFVITDWITMSRQLVEAPDIDPYASTVKRIVALGLTGEVSDIQKQAATKLVNQLYEASTQKKLRVTDTDRENGTTLERGMYDCFNSNPEMLSTTKLEKINSDLRERLVKYGTSNKATMTGSIVEWIGGTDNQVEFTTEELIEYEGKDLGTYMRCYYLISNMEDNWVIDDLQILEENEISGSELSSTKSRLAQ